MWVFVGATLLGALVALATKSNAPPLWSLGIVVIAAGVITLVSRNVRGREAESIEAPWTPPIMTPLRHDPVEEATGDTSRRVPIPRRTPEHRPASIGKRDEEMIDEICDALSEKQVRWLASNDFTTPWLDQHARPLVDLESLVADASGRQFPRDVRDALNRLAHALAAFVDFYAAHTFPDPVLLGDDWRFFDWDTPAASRPVPSDGELWGGLPVQMRELSVGVADAYQAFTAITAPSHGARRRKAGAQQ